MPEFWRVKHFRANAKDDPPETGSAGGLECKLSEHHSALGLRRVSGGLRLVSIRLFGLGMIPSRANAPPQFHRSSQYC